MKGDHRLDGGYEKFTAKERFELMIAAEARGDAAEAKRLVRLCPRETCTIADSRFVNLCDDAHTLALGVLADLFAIASRIGTLDAMLVVARTSFAIACDNAEYQAWVATKTGH